MSRRGYTHRDPTASRLPLSALTEVLVSLTNPSERYAFLAHAVYRAPVSVIADHLGQTVSETEYQLSRCRARLRHPGRAQALVDEMDFGDGLMLTSPDLRRFLDEIRGLERGACEYCLEKDVAWPRHPERGGRPRKFCSNRCRQAAYRMRRSADTAAPKTSGVSTHAPSST